MIALDTNVLVRYFTGDEPVQARAALALMEREANLFVPKTVLLEAEWVLRGGYAQGRPEILAAFEIVFDLPNVSIEDEERCRAALAIYADGVDFAHALHLASSSDCDALLTFDKRFASKARTLQTKPKVELAR